MNKISKEEQLAGAMLKKVNDIYDSCLNAIQELPEKCDINQFQIKEYFNDFKNQINNALEELPSSLNEFDCSYDEALNKFKEQE